MSATVVLPCALREYAEGATEIAIRAGTVDAALRELVARHPRLRRHLYEDNDQVRGYVRVYLNADEVATPEAAVQDGDVIMIVPSIAGGSPQQDTPFEDIEVARYARHITLPEVGWEGQQRLKQARVLVVGAGGLGSPVSLYLAAAGIGTIGLADFDAVDLSNLQRQILYATSDIGRPKVAAASERLAGINPHVRVVAHEERLTSANALDILRGYDVIVDGTDNFATRYLLSDACVLLDLPYVYGSIFRFDGQVSVFGGRDGPCYRCLFREPPPPGLVPSCAEGGVLGVLPGIIGSLQALEALKIVLGRGDSLRGRLALFDALAFRWRELRLKPSPSCPACGVERTITQLIDYDAFCGGNMADQQSNDTDELTPEQLRQRLETGEPLLLIDVREPYEWQIANLEAQGAQLIPLGDLADRLDTIDTDQEIVLYCRSGSRSASAQQHMRSRGFERVYNLRGGINAWAEQVDPSMTTY